MLPMSAELNRLIEMHTYCRPAGSTMETRFIERYISPLGAVCDAFGNYMVVIGDSPRVVWSSHTDTVHASSHRQRVRYQPNTGMLSARKSNDCLGADDTAGVWLMCEMIRRKVTGRYVFHFGEETGCEGSGNLVADSPSWLVDTDMVIALDRKGTEDIITHQCGMRTASDAFAHAIADQFNAGDTLLKYEPSAWGLYTDSEQYAGVVPECTNISIGYSANHSANETLDTVHALRLLERLCALDIDALPVKRTPGTDDDDDTKRASSSYSSSADSSFWDYYTERSARSTRRVLYCRECGCEVSEHQSACYDCGSDFPQAESDDDLARSTYLDGEFAKVQDALREQITRLSTSRRFTRRKRSRHRK